MSGSKFVFPPPPPPPPPPTITSYATSLQEKSNLNGKNFYGNSKANDRVRNRGNTPRGGRGGGTRYSSRTSSFRGGTPRGQKAALLGNATAQNSQDLGRSSKRAYTEAFPLEKKPARTAVAPSVPSFGSHIPFLKATITPNNSETISSKKTCNQLGLTPISNDHESSDEEEADEEERLAAKLASGDHTKTLQFSYRGKISSLKSKSEIAAWIAERKRNFPTKARIDDALLKEKRRKERLEVDQDNKKPLNHSIPGFVHRRSRVTGILPQPAIDGGDTSNTYQRAFHNQQLKEPKKPTRMNAKESMVANHGHQLQQDLYEAQKCLALSEDTPANNKLEALKCAEPGVKMTCSVAKPLDKHHSEDKKTDNITLLLQEALAQDGGIHISAGGPLIGNNVDKDGIDVLSEHTDLDEDTSSDGTSSSSSPDDDDSSTGSESDSAPPSMSSSALPPQEPTPAKQTERTPRNVCKYFKFGNRCRHGTSCRYSHDVSMKRARNEPRTAKQYPNTQKMTLYQRLLATQQEDEE